MLGAQKSLEDNYNMCNQKKDNRTVILQTEPKTTVSRSGPVQPMMCLHVFVRDVKSTPQQQHIGHVSYKKWES